MAPAESRCGRRSAGTKSKYRIRPWINRAFRGLRRLTTPAFHVSVAGLSTRFTGYIRLKVPLAGLPSSVPTVSRDMLHCALLGHDESNQPSLLKAIILFRPIGSSPVQAVNATVKR